MLETVLQNPCISVDQQCYAYTAAGSDCYLDGVPPRLAHVLQVQGLVGGFIVPPLNGKRRGIDANLHGCRPVGVHLSVFVVVTLELQLKVRPVDRRWKTIFKNAYLL